MLFLAYAPEVTGRAALVFFVVVVSSILNLIKIRGGRIQQIVFTGILLLNLVTYVLVGNTSFLLSGEMYSLIYVQFVN